MIEIKNMQENKQMRFRKIKMECQFTGLIAGVAVAVIRGPCLRVVCNSGPVAVKDSLLSPIVISVVVLLADMVPSTVDGGSKSTDKPIWRLQH